MSAFRDKDFEVVFDKGTVDCIYVITFYFIILQYNINIF